MAPSQYELYEGHGEEEESPLNIPDGEDDFQELKPCRQRLGLKTTYVRHWKKSHAFREFCQNWNDAMIKKSGISRQKLVYVHNDTVYKYKIAVHHPTSNKMLGFLVFDKNKGMLELCNFDSQLSRSALDMGGTSKDGDKDMAGSHGEGFKLAALLMLREGHQTKFTASGFYWNFRWATNDETTLWCFMSKVKPRPSSQYGPRRPQTSSDALTSDPWEDVSVKVGNVYGRGAKAITEAEFLNWLKVFLHFDRPTGQVETPHGTIIWQQDFVDKIYLKGLFLDSMSARGSYKYGYDLAEGHIGRDRKEMEDQRQIGRILASIWEAAIQSDSGSSGLLDWYIAMLRGPKEWWDTANIADYMSLSTAMAVWDRLVKPNQQRQASEKIFYYGEQDAEKNAGMIEISLRKRPMLLPNAIWAPLRKYNLSETPTEYGRRKLCATEDATVPDTPYAKTFQRTLNAALDLYRNRNTRFFDLVFKKTNRSSLDLCLYGSKILIHERWLDFKDSHRRGDPSCPLSRMSSSQKVVVENFSCDHIIIDLYSQILRDVDEDTSVSPLYGGTPARVLLQLASECLRNMPRSVKICLGEKAGSICVSWIDIEAERLSQLHGVKLKCHIVLHRNSTCLQRRKELLATQTYGKNMIGKMLPWDCQCPQQIVTSKHKSVTFANLDVTDYYFPMIARADAPVAFYSSPPASLRPAAFDTKVVETSAPPKTIEQLQKEIISLQKRIIELEKNLAVKTMQLNQVMDRQAAEQKLVTEAKAAEKEALDLLTAARSEVKRAKQDKQSAEDGEKAMTKVLRRMMNNQHSDPHDETGNRRRERSASRNMEEGGELGRAVK